MTIVYYDLYNTVQVERQSKKNYSHHQFAPTHEAGEKASPISFLAKLFMPYGREARESNKISALHGATA